MTKTFTENVTEHLRAGYQGMFVQTAEEMRVEQELGWVAKQLNYKLYTWDLDSGYQFRAPPIAEGERPPRAPQGGDALQGHAKGKPAEALDLMLSNQLNCDHLFILRDFDDFWNQDAMIRRKMRNLVESNALVGGEFMRQFVVISPVSNVHPKLKHALAVIDFALPDEAQLMDCLQYVKNSIEASAGRQIALEPPIAEKLVRSVAGLTRKEAENALCKTITRFGSFSDECIPDVLDQKAQIIKKGEILTFVPYEKITTREHIGGYELLMEFMERRKQAYGKEAQAMHIDMPKGVALLGPPGVGKSVVAMTLARVLELPCYIADISSVFGSLVGESEARMKDMLRMIEAQRGCVLVLDEADKALGGAHQANFDSGVTKRVFGQLLSWLANKNDRTFVVMTMNRMKGISPETLRAGRFDAVFYVDLPSPRERRQILDIHLRKRHVDPAALDLGEDDWAELVNKTNEFSGSELEEVVREARYHALADHGNGTPTADQLFEAVSQVRPVATLDREGLEEMRKEGKDRARPVSLPDTTPVKDIRRMKGK